MDQHDFWQAVETLVATSEIVIDRPKGSAHPHYGEKRYPLDYGYLQGTRSGDGAGIDVWLGSLSERNVTGLIVTIDLHKRDSEMKVLVGCTRDEMYMILALHRVGSQSALLLNKPVKLTRLIQPQSERDQEEQPCVERSL